MAAYSLRSPFYFTQNDESIVNFRVGRRILIYAKFQNIIHLQNSMEIVYDFSSLAAHTTRARNSETPTRRKSYVWKVFACTDEKKTLEIVLVFDTFQIELVAGESGMHKKLNLI